MKRLMLILAMVFVLVSTIPMVESLKETTILDGWVRYDHSFVYDNKTYSITTLETGDRDHPENGKIVIRAPNGTEMLSYGECKENEIYKYCFENVTFGGKYVDIDKFGQVQPGLKLKLIEFDYEILLKIDRWFEKTKFNLYDSGNVDVTIINTGDQILNDMYIEDTIPNGFEIVSSINMQKINSSTVIFGPLILYPDKTWSGRYKIKATNYSSGSYSTKVNYISEDGTEKEQISSDSKISVIEPYTLTVSKIKESYDGDENIIFNLKLENKENEDLIIDEFDIYTPQNMETSITNNLDRLTNSHFIVSDKIDAEDSDEYEIKMKPSYTGKYSLSYYIKFHIKDKEYVESKRIPIIIKTKGLSCYFEIKEKEFEAGNIVNFNTTIDNTDDENYYEIKGETKNPLGTDIAINKTNLEKGKSYSIDGQMTFPMTSEDKTYNLSVEINYRSVDLEEFVCKNELAINVKGKEKYIDVEVETTDNQLAKVGEKSELQFKVKNLVDKKFSKLYVEHELLDNITSTGFSRKQFDNLGSKETVDAYSTIISIPKTFNKKYLTIQVSVGAENPEYENTFTVKVPVNLTIDETKSEKTDKSKGVVNNSGEKTENKKSVNKEEGFVDKVINFFVRLFKGKKE